MGVANMYKHFLTYCQAEIRQAMMIFTNPENYPVHIHCTQGKDRTGIVCALLLSMAGAPRDVIIRDYAKTQAGLAPIRDGMLKELHEAGLSDDFADAPAQNMISMLEYIDQEYGSVSQYLTGIGFNEEDQQRVRDIIGA
ncbi:protein-tyrosine phosphatase-like protein [Syncephalastrum racemosum]|uniref:Protein-tyrosine phosphatase-like protein n=1 Tax=Syncephalastrum racemosum TaxID=13706 RepID=A0A1X2HU89_SYNRA|nr:protein-tyrosine phosphatase-like protein [Syncephalastrum racemosum]